MPFSCTICETESTRICSWCTKDTCANHLCERCERCSDCCECEVPLDEPVRGAGSYVHHTVRYAPPEPNPEPQPEPPHPPPDPDPFPPEPLARDPFSPDPVP
jgi:hypothetical protein